jgi:CDP-diacylglycerol--serine O-phosphatidyltransferase
MKNKNKKLKKFSKKPFYINLLIPNTITLLGLCFGLSALKFGLNSNWNLALFAILFAMLFDVIDGMAARFLNATSIFGAQLDSLSDFVCFGVVPGFIIFLWSNTYYNNMFCWVSVIFYIFSIVIRLARFNTDSIKSQDKDKNLNSVSDFDKNNIENKKIMNFFKGIPAPASAILALFPIILSNKDGLGIVFDINFFRFFLPIWLLLVSYFAISTIPTPSIKNIKINNKYFSILIAIAGFTIIMIVTYTWIIIPLIVIIYIFSIIFTIVKYKKLTKI